VPVPTIPAAGSSPDDPITVHCLDALGRQRSTRVFVRDGRVVVDQPAPGAAIYDWHGAAELSSAMDHARTLLPGTR